MIIEYQLMDLFQKITVLNEESHTKYIQTQNPTPLTNMQAIVLDYILVESATHDVFAKDLEEYFGIKASSVSSLLDYLERAGYVSRDLVPEDRRLKRLVPTAAAKEIEAWLLEAIHYSIVDVFAGFTGEEMQLLRSLMEKMRVNLSSMAAKGKPFFSKDSEVTFPPEA